GDFAEKGKEEVELKDVVYELRLLVISVSYPFPLQLTDSTLPHVLVLADRFQMQQVLVQSEEYLVKTTKFSKALKLHLSDQYRLEGLKYKCLLGFHSVADIISLESTPEYAQFSDKLKAAILDRAMKIGKPAN
ncbi:hypothetical protein PMAYCL1PPCAC_25538, partial [Pristionchus mayeri]